MKSSCCFRIVLSAFIILNGIDCAPTAYQGLRICKRGEISVGIGVGVPSDFSLCLRYGVAKNCDIGMKWGGIPKKENTHGFFGDFKFSFLNQGFLVAADLGTMYTNNALIVDHDIQTHSYHPTLLMGTERVYAGIGWNYCIRRDNYVTVYPQPQKMQKVTHSSGPRCVFGVSWGKRWNFNPEIIINFDPLMKNEAEIMIGCGIHKFFCGKKDVALHPKHSKPTEK